MDNLPKRLESRREFLRGAARGGLLTLLVAVGALAARRRGAGAQRCVNLGVCRGCGVYVSCGLPAALSAKGAQSGG
jgi:hypothetical protein